jgi:hypothetical protein
VFDTQATAQLPVGLGDGVGVGEGDVGVGVGVGVGLGGGEGEVWFANATVNAVKSQGFWATPLHSLEV